MITIDYLQNKISEQLIAENEARENNHKSSGKLSASKLGAPLQHQILHTMGVTRDAIDSYTLAKFQRGRHVEDWLRGAMPNLIDKEKFCEYRDAIGYVDVLVDMTSWDISNVMGVIPHEIKSVANASYKWIKKDGYKRGHALQATLYALALGTDWFVLDYVASDDYRVKSFLVETREHKADVDKAIDEYNQQLKMGTVPVFKAKEKWQNNIKYNEYSLFVDLNETEIETLLKTEYGKSYKKLKEVKVNGKK